MAVNIILVEASPRDPADGVAQAVRLAGNGVLPYTYASGHWHAGIEALPPVIGSLDYDEEIVGGGVAQAMTLSFAGRPSVVNALAGLLWADAPVVVRIGPETGGLPAVAQTGKVLSHAVNDGKLSIVLADPAADLMKPFPVERYLGTGGLEGPADWLDKIKRRLWGRIWNIAAEPLDPANNILCVSDPRHPLLNIGAVRHRGAPAGSLVPLGWQGSAEATLAALQASTAPEGGGIVCPSIACIKWWTDPDGDLHADVQGEIGDGYIENTASVAARLAMLRGGPAFVAGAASAAAALRPAPMGWVVDDETTTVSAMLDEMLADVGLLWVVTALGQIDIHEWAWGAPVASAISEDVSRTKVIKPVTSRKLGYRNNESRMARGDLAGIVLATEVAFLDGRSAQELAEVEANATNGAPSGTPVGAITADDVSSTIKEGGGVANGQVGTGAILNNAVTATNFAMLDLFGASVGTDDDNVWRDFAYMGVALQTSFSRPTDADNSAAMFQVSLVGTRTGGDNDRVSVRVRRSDGTLCQPSEFPYLRFQGGGNDSHFLIFYDANPLAGTNSYVVQVKNVEGHPAWDRGIIVPVRYSK